MTKSGFMETEWGKQAAATARAERLPSVFDLRLPERPDDDLELPDDPSTLGDEDIVYYLQKISLYHSDAEASVGVYSAMEEFVSSEYRDMYADAYMERFGDEGKPKNITIAEAEMYVESSPELRFVRQKLRDVRMGLHVAKGYAKSLARLSMTYSMILKYRQLSGDRSGTVLPPQSDTEDGW